MTLQQLEYVIALDTYRHFVTAAEKCYVTQPTLTMQVKKLENEIGMKLFDRSKKPMRPTPIGEIFVMKARQLLRDAKELIEITTEEFNSLKGTFRLGIIPTLAPYVLPLFLKSFLEEHPETSLIIDELQSEEIIKRLKSDQLDIGILVTPLDEKVLREIPLFEEPFYLYTPADHPWRKKESVAPQLLDNKDLLLLTEGHCFREQMLAICSSNETNNERNFVYESGSIEALKNLVKKGMGYTLVPYLSIDEKVDKGHITPFRSPVPVREVSLVVHNNFSKHNLINTINKSILQGVPAALKKKQNNYKVRWR